MGWVSFREERPASALLVRSSARRVSHLLASCQPPPAGLQQYPIVKGVLEESRRPGRQRFPVRLLIFVGLDEHDGTAPAAVVRQVPEFRAAQ
jgi:hypothetical protein